MTPLLFPSSRRTQAGLSLVEILVGVAIGLIGILAMFQIMANWEGRKRTTAAGSDAQIAGSVALYRLEQDLRLAGYGFGAASSSASPYMGCTVSAYDSSRPGNNFSFPLAPVLIADGASGAPDTVTILYGASTMPTLGQSFTASTTTTNMMSIRTGYQLADLVIVAGTGCGLVEITDNTNADGKTINHAVGNYVNPTPDPNNAGTLTLTARYNSAAGFAAGASGMVFDLGFRDLPRRDIWQIRNGKTLTVSDDLHYADSDGDGLNDWVEVGEGVINLQAEYGEDANGDHMVDTWTSTTPATSAVWSQVIAIRVGLLARSQQFEKTAVTTVAPSWAGGSFVMTNVDGSTDSTPGNDNDWRHYRYRVYETVIPLRNVLWGTTSP